MLNYPLYILKYLKKDFFQLIYHITFRCNSRCNFCFNWREINKNEEKELTLEEIEKISGSMPKFPWLLLSGGEPTLRNDLVEIIGIFYKNNKIKHLTFPTNGLLPAKIFETCESLLKKYKNLTVTISFSLDALGQEHDRIRGVRGCYEKVIESYRSLAPLRKNKNLNIKFNSVISNINHKNLNELIKEIRKLKPDMHTIDFVRGDVRNKSINLPPREEIDKILKIIKDNYNYYHGFLNIKKHSIILPKISLAIQKEYLDLFKEIIIKEKQIIPCLAYKTSLVLYPYGDVSFCEPMNTFANFREYNYNYKKIINSKPAKQNKMFIKNKCCFCYHPCNQYLNILLNPGRMAKEIFKNVF